jgi:hypothetical protein
MNVFQSSKRVSQKRVSANPIFNTETVVDSAQVQFVECKNSNLAALKTMVNEVKVWLVCV